MSNGDGKKPQEKPKEKSKEDSLIKALFNKILEGASKTPEARLWREVDKRQTSFDSATKRNWEPWGDFAQQMVSEEDRLIRLEEWDNLITQVLGNADSRFPIYSEAPPREADPTSIYSEYGTPSIETSFLNSLEGNLVQKERQALRGRKYPYGGDEGPPISLAPDWVLKHSQRRDLKDLPELRDPREPNVGRDNITGQAWSRFGRKEANETIVPQIRRGVQQRLDEIKTEAEAGGRRTARTRKAEKEAQGAGPSKPTMEERVYMSLGLASPIEARIEGPEGLAPPEPVVHETGTNKALRKGAEAAKDFVSTPGGVSRALGVEDPIQADIPSEGSRPWPYTDPEGGLSKTVQAFREESTLGQLLDFASAGGEDPFAGADPASALRAIGTFLTRPPYRLMAETGPEAFAQFRHLSNQMHSSNLGGLQPQLAQHVPLATNTPIEFALTDPSRPGRHAPIGGRYQLETPEFTKLAEGRRVGESAGFNPLHSQSITGDASRQDLNLRLMDVMPDVVGPMGKEYLPDPRFGDVKFFGSTMIPEPNMAAVMDRMSDVLSEPEFAQLITQLADLRRQNPMRYKPLEDIFSLPPTRRREVELASEALLDEVGMTKGFGGPKRRKTHGSIDQESVMPILEQESERMAKIAEKSLDTPAMNLEVIDQMLTEAVSTGPGMMYPGTAYGDVILDPGYNLMGHGEVIGGLPSYTDKFFLHGARTPWKRAVKPGDPMGEVSLFRNVLEDVSDMLISKDRAGTLGKSVGGFYDTDIEYLRRRETSKLLDELWRSLAGTQP